MPSDARAALDIRALGIIVAGYRVRRPISAQATSNFSNFRIA